MADETKLFHGTGLYCLAAILDEDRLYEGAYWRKPGEPHGPRFTTDVAVAGEFAIYNTYYAEGGILVLDRGKLAVDFELVDHVDTVSGALHDFEKEVAAITPVIENLSQYLIAVLVEPRFIDEMCSDELVETAWSEGGWPSSYSRDKKGAEAMRAALQKLKENPLVNCIDMAEHIPRHGNIELHDALIIS